MNANPTFTIKEHKRHALYCLYRGPLEMFKAHLHAIPFYKREDVQKLYNARSQQP